jgi:hypothetical protein
MRTRYRASWPWCLVAALAVAGCDLFGEIEPVQAGADVAQEPADAGADLGEADGGPTGGPDADACVPGDEVCNGADDDCDGDVDEGCADGDGDGWCVAQPDAPGGQGVCAHPEPDCDDDDPTINPGEAFVCGAQRSCPRVLGVPRFGDQVLVAGDPSVRMADVVESPSGLTALWLESTVSGSELRMGALSTRGVLLDGMLLLDAPGAVERAALAWDPTQSAYAVAWVTRLDDGSAQGAVQLVGEDLTPIGAPSPLQPAITPTRLEVLAAPGTFAVVSSSRTNGSLETDLWHTACQVGGAAACGEPRELNVAHEDLPATARFGVIEGAGPGGRPAFGALMAMVGADDLDRLTLFDVRDGARVPYAGDASFREDYALPAEFSRMAVRRLDVTRDGAPIYTLSGVPTGARDPFFVFVEANPDGTFGAEIARVQDRGGGLQQAPLMRDGGLIPIGQGARGAARPLWVDQGQVTYLLSLGGAFSLGELATPTSSGVDVEPVSIGFLGRFSSLSRVHAFEAGSSVVLTLPEREGFPLWSFRAIDDPPVTELNADLDAASRGASLGDPFRASDAFALPGGGHAVVGRGVAADGLGGDWELIVFDEAGDLAWREELVLPAGAECGALEVSGGLIFCADAALDLAACTARRSRWVRTVDGLGAQGQGTAGSWTRVFARSQAPQDSVDAGVCCLGRIRDEQAFELVGGGVVVPFSGVELDDQDRCVLQNATFRTNPPGTFSAGVPYARDYGAYGRWSEFIVAGPAGTRREPLAWEDLEWGAEVRLTRAERYDDVGAVLMAETDASTYVAYLDTFDREVVWREVPAPLVDPAEREEAQVAYTLWSQGGAKGLFMAYWDEGRGELMLTGFGFGGQAQEFEQTARALGPREARVVPVGLEGFDRQLALTVRIEPSDDALGDEVRHEVLVFDRDTGASRLFELPTDQAPALAVDSPHLLAFWVDAGGEFTASYDLATGDLLGSRARRRFYGDGLDGVTHWPLVGDEVRWLVRDNDALRMSVGVCAPPE